MRLFSVACCSVPVSVGDSSCRHRRDCTDSRNSVYKLFLSASAFEHFKLVSILNGNRISIQKRRLTLTPGGSLGLICLLAVQVFEELHGLPSHDDLLEDGFEEGHHGELPVAGGLIPSGAAAGHVAHFLLVLHRLRHAVQRVGGVPEVAVVHWDVLVPTQLSLLVMAHQNFGLVGHYLEQPLLHTSG